jgi:predicted RNA-binding protein Jag
MKKTKKQIEIEAATVKEAIKKAKEMLAFGEQEGEIKILKEEKQGLFGMEGEQKARIRVSI